MEALVAVSVSALTIYDMCKAVDKSMNIGEIRLVRKSGGKSGLFLADKLVQHHFDRFRNGLLYLGCAPLAEAGSILGFYSEYTDFLGHI